MSVSAGTLLLRIYCKMLKVQSGISLLLSFIPKNREKKAFSPGVQDEQERLTAFFFCPFPSLSLQSSLFHLWFKELFTPLLIIVQLVKNLPAMKETPVLFLSWEDPLEKG